MSTLGIGSGLCSVTLRERPLGEVVDVAMRVGLDAIEWGADVHVRPGEKKVARTARTMCESAGLATPSYGSYVGTRREAGSDQAVIDTTLELGAQTIRVWAGERLNPEPDPDTWLRIAERIHAFSSRADTYSLSVGVEYHFGTLTETAPGALSLIDALPPNAYLYWQPLPGRKSDYLVPDYVAVSRHVSHMHVYWWRSVSDRRPLKQGAQTWKRVLELHARARHRFPLPAYCYLEFVPDDSIVALERDARTLLMLLRALPSDRKIQSGTGERERRFSAGRG